MRMIDIGDVRDGQKFQIGPNRKGLLRVLEATSVTSLGVMFSVSPHTWTTKQPVMFANFKDKDFWAILKPYKEKIVHRADVIWYRFKPALGVDSELIHRYIYGEGQILGDHVTELLRTTVEYTEEK